jgi:copper chaperone CopZ
LVAGALDRLPGVKVQNVSYAKSRADVLYDPKKATIAQMAGALGKYGYKAYAMGKSK